MKLLRGVSLLILVTVLAACGTRGIPNTGAAVRVASGDTTEELLLGEMYAQVLEANDIPVERKLTEASDEAIHNALIQKQIDVYPGFTSAAYLTVMGMKDGETDPDQIHEKVRKYFERRWKITWLNSSATSDAATPVVWQDVLERYPNMVSLLNQVSDQITPEAMTALINKVDVDKQKPAQVAKDFLTEKGLLK